MNRCCLSKKCRDASAAVVHSLAESSALMQAHRDADTACQVWLTMTSLIWISKPSAGAPTDTHLRPGSIECSGNSVQAGRSG